MAVDEAGLHAMLFVLVTVGLATLVCCGFLAHNLYLDTRKHEAQPRTEPLPHKPWKVDEATRKKVEAVLARLKAGRQAADEKGEPVYLRYADWSSQCVLQSRCACPQLHCLPPTACLLLALPSARAACLASELACAMLPKSTLFAPHCLSPATSQRLVGRSRRPATPQADSLTRLLHARYTGTLRAHRVSPQRTVAPTAANATDRPDYADHRTGYPSSEAAAAASFRPKIPVLSGLEQKSLRRAGRIGREVLDLAALAVQPGVRCDEIDAIVHEATLNRKAYPSPLNYYGFPKSVCTSVNEVICHGVPDGYELQSGDIVNIDVTVYFEGFHADLNETYFVGGRDAVEPDTLRLVQTAYECLFEAIKACRPGELYRGLGSTIQPWAERNGCSVCRTYCGHGVGRLFHCAPTIPHYSSNKTVGAMAAGHAFTVEPMLNLGGHRDKRWPDGWTAVTADGSRSAQFEHTLLVTETGVEIVTARLPTSRCDVVTSYDGGLV